MFFNTPEGFTQSHISCVAESAADGTVLCTMCQEGNSPEAPAVALRVESWNPYSAAPAAIWGLCAVCLSCWEDVTPPEGDE